MAAAAPPAPLLARATDLAVLDKHFTVRAVSTRGFVRARRPPLR